jgi:hypothetical protein
MCKVCDKTPNSHCFIKIDANTYYSSVARSSDFTDATALAEHIKEVVIPFKPWVWIFDCKGITAKHMAQFDVVRRVQQILFDDAYGGSLQRFIAVNMSVGAKKVIDMLLPFLTERARGNIVTCGTSPLEIMGRLTGCSMEVMRWINKVVVLDIGEALPAII